MPKPLPCKPVSRSRMAVIKWLFFYARAVARVPDSTSGNCIAQVLQRSITEIIFEGRKKCNSTRDGDDEVFNLSENPHPARVSGLHKISSENSQRNFSVNYVHYVSCHANICDRVS